jgi:hypothetical protein
MKQLRRRASTFRLAMSRRESDQNDLALPHAVLIGWRTLLEDVCSAIAPAESGSGAGTTLDCSAEHARLIEELLDSRAGLTTISGEVCGWLRALFVAPTNS